MTDCQQLPKMLISRVFAHEEQFFQKTSLLVAPKFIIFLTIEGGVPKLWYLPTSPFQYAYKTVSQMFQFIVKNGICHLRFLQHDTQFDHKVPPNEMMMLNFKTA